MIHFQRLILFQILNSVPIRGRYRSMIVTKFSPEKLETVSKPYLKIFVDFSLKINLTFHWKFKLIFNEKSTKNLEIFRGFAPDPGRGLQAPCNPLRERLPSRYPLIPPPRTKILDPPMKTPCFLGLAEKHNWLRNFW